MASAVDEVSALLGIPQQTKSDPDDLKSPEQHQASMFAARQQLQAKQKGSSPTFQQQSSSSAAVKKVAAIKPQFKTLSKKSSFTTPFIKKDSDHEKQNPIKKPPVDTNLDKLRDAGSVSYEKQLPTVSSRYHSPSLKRQRGRQVEDYAPSDEEHRKTFNRSPKKSFPSPEQKNVKLSSKTSSKLPSPKICPKPSNKLTSPKSSAKTCTGSTHSPAPLSQSGHDVVIESTNPKESTEQSEESDLQKEAESTEQSEESEKPNKKEPVDSSTANEKEQIASKAEECDDLIEAKNPETIIDSQGGRLLFSDDEEDSKKEGSEEKPSEKVLGVGSNKEEEEADNQTIQQEYRSTGENLSEIPEDKPSREVAKRDTVPLPGAEETKETEEENVRVLLTSQEETEEKEVKVLLTPQEEVKEKEVKVLLTSQEEVKEKEVKVLLTSQEETEGKEVKVLLTPQEESLHFSSQDENPEYDDTCKKENISPTLTPTKNTDEANRQKVNDFFTNKFGLTFNTASTPKGADRPKPLLKFSRKDGSDNERHEYSPSGKSPGKFKSTFKELGDVEEESDEKTPSSTNTPDSKSSTSSEKPSLSPTEKKPPPLSSTEKKSKPPAEKKSGAPVPSRGAPPPPRLEKKTKRKMERSPQRGATKETLVRNKETLARERSRVYTTSCSNSEEEEEEEKKEKEKVCKKKPPQKQKRVKPVNSRKRHKVYSSSSSSSNASEDEFSFSAPNTDNSDSIWVQCEKCEKWRYLRDTPDPNLIPDNWTCTLNPDKRHNNCKVPEEQWSQLDVGYEFVYSAYSLGSLVWCKMQGYPWWPGMIDNDPLTKTFYYRHANSELPDKYHVTFFGIQATRAWIASKFIKVYNPDDKEDRYDQRKSGKGMREALAMANQAFLMELNDRKKIYGFKEQQKSEDSIGASTSKTGNSKGVRGRGRPRKVSKNAKPTKKRKLNKSSEEKTSGSYIPAPGSFRSSSFHVIENIENEINKVLRDCSPSS